jgi:hypothetical protein
MLDPQGVTREVPFAPTLLVLLPDIVYRGLSVPHLKRVLAAHLDKPLIRSRRFARGVRDMFLTGVPLKAAQRLGVGEPLVSLLRDEPEHERVYLTMAYIFIEGQLLLPPP